MIKFWIFGVSPLFLPNIYIEVENRRKYKKRPKYSKPPHSTQGFSMTTAALLLLLAGLLIFLYYLIMFQGYGRLSHLFGMLAGLWAFFGVFFVMAGAVGTGYFMFFFIILIIGYVANYAVPEEYYEGLLEKVGEVTQKVPSLSFSEENYERIPVIKDMNEESGLGILTAFVVILFYFLFLLTPVTPADSDETAQFDRKESTFQFFPQAKQIEYTNGMAKVAIITIRMIPISKGIVDSAIEKAEPEIRDHIKEEAGRDAEIEEIEDNNIERNGHDAVQKVYKVEWSEIGEPQTQKGTMVLEGWYCSNKMQVVVVAYFYPSKMGTITRNLAEDVQCH